METTEPTTIFQGAPVAWTKTLADYPADVWTLEYTFINVSQKFTVVCTASGTDHLAEISAVDCAALVPGIYGWQSKATKFGAAEVVAIGQTEIIQDYALATTLETRSHNRIVLDAIKAVLEGRASEDHISVSVAGRSVAKMSLAELTAAEAIYERRVANETARATGTARRKILVRFPGA